MEFTLAHGTGNDFVVLADLDDQLTLDADLVRALCDRRRGLGADGVLRIGATRDPRAVAWMDHRNADGSVAEMCGNGVRVVAKYLVDHGVIAVGDDGRVAIATNAGLKPVVVTRGPDGRVIEASVDMGPPVLEPARVPFEADEEAATTHEVALAPDADGTTDERVELTVVSMGNPHGVLLVDDVDAAPVASLGPRLETHDRFPAHANIGFAQVVDRTSIRLRVWERGVGETAACGTGACAAVVALRAQGLLDDEVAVHLPGGTLRIAVPASTDDLGTVTMTGPAVEIASGVLDGDWLRAVGPRPPVAHPAHLEMPLTGARFDPAADREDATL